MRGGQQAARCLTTKTRIDAETETLIPTIGGGFVDAAIAFTCKDHGADVSVEVAPTMRAMGHSGSHANAGGQLAVCVTGDVTHTLKAEGFDASEDGTGRGQPIVAAFQEIASTLRVPSNGAAWRGDGCDNFARQGMAVRRLTPTECEALQGFPRNYTRIPGWNGWRAMDASETPEKCVADALEVRQTKNGKWRVKDVDGPRYKALGNSMAVPCMAWIGWRITAVEAIPSMEKAA